MIPHKVSVQSVCAWNSYFVVASPHRITFCLTSTRYFEYMVVEEHLQNYPAKVRVVAYFSITKTSRYIQRLLGIPRNISSFISNLLGKEQFIWSASCQKAFNEIKDKFTLTLLLVHSTLSSDLKIRHKQRRKCNSRLVSSERR